MERFELAFSGLPSRTGPLTFGQQAMWNNLKKITPHDEHVNICFPVPLREGVAVGSVTEALRTLLTRHEALRTVYRDDGGGAPRQEVRGSGAVEVLVVECAASSREQGRQTAKQEINRHFDPAADLPLRVALVRWDGGVRELLLSVCHLASDAAGNAVIRRELTHLLTPRRPSLPPVRGRQPVDHALWERSEKVTRAQTRRADYWRRTFMECAAVPPMRPAGDGRSGEGARFRHGELLSPGLDAAASVAARGLGVSQAAVLLAALTEELARRAGAARLPMFLRVANRHFPGVKETVACLAQNSLLLVGADPAGLHRTAVNIHTGMMKALLHAHYDPAVRDGVQADLAELGVRLRPEELSTFNHIPSHLYSRPNAVPVPGGGRFTWLEEAENEHFRFFVNAGPGDRLSLFADTRHLPADAVEDCLRQASRRILAQT
ncbi:condensation domain-containing protein [Streptomyces cyaneogriseus]|nr:condensation domain-containing protein [Streptomyces cyaneogriseus]